MPTQDEDRSDEPTPLQFGFRMEEVQVALNKQRKDQEKRNERVQGALALLAFIPGCILVWKLFGTGLSQASASKGLDLGRIAGGLVGAIAIVATTWTFAFAILHAMFGSSSANKDSELRLDPNSALETKYRAYLNARDAYEMSRRAYWLGLTGLEFEQKMAELFRKDGWNAELTKATGDGGVDIILRKAADCAIVQCKATKSPVGPGPLREFHGVLVTNKTAKRAIFVSLGGFTKAAGEFGRESGMLLLSIDDVLAMANSPRLV